jgi:hypothetical protein
MASPARSTASGRVNRSAVEKEMVLLHNPDYVSMSLYDSPVIDIFNLSVLFGDKGRTH